MPPLPFACSPGLHPPCLHVPARWGQSGQSVPPPFPFASRPLRPSSSPPGLCATRRAHALPTLCVNAGGGAGGTVRTPPSIRPSARATPPRPLGYDAPRPLERMPGGTGDGAPPPVCGQSPLPGLLSPLHSRAPLRLHALHPFCAHAGSAGGMGVRARGGPHARGPRAMGGGTERWAVQPEQRTMEARRVCLHGEAQPGRWVLRASGAGVRK